MRRTARIAIGLSVLVLLAGILYVGTRDAPTPPPEPADATLRLTEAGEVVGFIARNGARAWLGIPFAAAPEGDLRWRAPTPPSPRAERIQALAFGPCCPQYASVLTESDNLNPEADRAVVGSEDCLYLNVWSPPNARDLPVMVWIHGGGNSIGHGGNVRGANLAVSEDVVVVSINYRLGLLGWFAHPALTSGDPVNDSGNFGTLDIVRALEWVRDNIGPFGGDPANVTVFGESAGGHNTLAMLASPLASGLFHRAIVQSGGYDGVPMSSARNYADAGGLPVSAREVTNALLIADGRAAGPAAARAVQDSMQPAEMRRYLYGKRPEKLFEALGDGAFGMVYVPTNFRDGHVLPDRAPLDVFADAAGYSPVPVLLGTNRDEPALFMVRDPRYVKTLFGIPYAFQDEATYRRQVYYGGLAYKARRADELADAFTASGNPDVYVYRWDWDEEPGSIGLDLSVALGAAHALEIPFVFGDFDYAFSADLAYPDDAAQAQLSRSMMSYWAEFAYTGKPGRGRSGAEPEWLPWGKEGMTSILLDTEADGGIRMDDKKLNLADVRRELVADANFASAEEKCTTYVRLFFYTWRDDTFDPDEYAALGCEAWPPEQVSPF